MRVLVEMRRDAEGRVSGAVGRWPGERRRTFSGWLDLVRILESHIESDALDPDGIGPDGIDGATHEGTER